MIGKKTGALIETSAILGCSLEQTSKENISLFTKLGKLFGQIFQIKDDYLGINRAGIEIITELMKEINDLESKIEFLESEVMRFKSRGTMKELPEKNRRYL